MTVSPYALVCFLALCLFGCESTDSRDERALRSRCAIPEYAKLVDYDGYPAMIGFGQREGLEVSGRYRLNSDQAIEFNKSALSNGWHSLPVPEEIRSKILFRGLKVNLRATDGLFRCRTAGDNVLYSSISRPCEEVDYLGDVMISIFERTKLEISAVVRSGY